MPQVRVKAFRFHSNAQLEMYKKEGKEKGMFEFPKELAKFEASKDEIIIPILEELASVELKGTILKAQKKNEDGFWDFCVEREGKLKGDWGSQSAESKALEAQEGTEEGLRAVN